MNARGRLSTVSQDGTLAATYTYDMSEQRIVKAVSGEAAIHYHYDGEGRLIAETDAATGETIRDYVWLGLTPIASFGAANDNAPIEDCADEIAALEADIADRTSRIDNNAAWIIELGELAADKQGRIATNAARITELGNLITDKQSRINTHAARITELGALIADKQSRIAANAARITELDALILDKQNRIEALNPVTRADRITELEALIITHQERIVFLTDRNAELAILITGHETRIDELTTRNAELASLITAHQTRIGELSAINTTLTERSAEHEDRIVFLTERNAVLATQRDTFQAELDALLASGCDDPSAGSNVTFLHSDHLGRPKFATDSDGNVTWDGGITTPFGLQVTALAAQTQALMFPGQYEDAETTGAGVTLSHNWHRTYDPTLGRYLQSDPIGLAGGLNRYAYALNNPVVYYDPDGRLVPLLVGAAIGIGFELLTNECATFSDLVVAGILGGAGGGIGAKIGLKFAGKPGPNKVFSHFAPTRWAKPDNKIGRHLPKSLSKYIKGRNLGNGNYVNPSRHYRHDKYYYGHLKSHKGLAKQGAWGERLNPIAAFLDRVPRMHYGFIGGMGVGVGVNTQLPNCGEC